MRTRVISLILVIVMLLGVLAGCGKSDVVSTEQAQKIAMEAAGITAGDVTDVHTHIVTENGIPCYSVHISSAKGDFSYIITASDGEILSGGEGSGH